LTGSGSQAQPRACYRTHEGPLLDQQVSSVRRGKCDRRANFRGTWGAKALNATSQSDHAGSSNLIQWHENDTIYGMKTTIDSAGRIVVPKALRQALNLRPGQMLEIRAGDGRLEIEVTATPMSLKKKGKTVVAIPEVELPTLTADTVRETLEQIRR